MEDSRVWLWNKVEWLRRRFLNQLGLLDNRRKRLLSENGAKLLEAQIRFCEDKCRCNPITSFSAKQVLEATNYFQSHFSEDASYKWYKGTLNNVPVLIKKYKSNYESGDSAYYDNIVISFEMNSHKNALELLGCCLEFTYPVLVYEDAENGPLGGNDLRSFSSLPWSMRLKVAKEIADVIAYLHTTFERPIIHRDIKPSKFFLDKDFVPKCSDFSHIIRVPEEKAHAADLITGTPGYLDPIYVNTGTITASGDVYSFGVLLLVLLTGRHAFDTSRPGSERSVCTYAATMVEQGRFKEALDPKILEEEGEINEETEQQVQAYLKLALSCINLDRGERPLMIYVAKDLSKIEKSTH